MACYLGVSMSVMIETFNETFNLLKKFDNLTAVEDLCIQVNKGEILGFLGPTRINCGEMEMK